MASLRRLIPDRLLRMLLSALLLAMLSFAAQPLQPVQAATYPCSEAGLDAAIAAGGGPHDFGAGACTITVMATKTITGTLILAGTGSGGSLTISGGGLIQVFDVTGTGSLTLNALTITNGFTATNGGAISNNGTLDLVDVTISNSEAGNYGGGIYNLGDLLITRGVVSGNTADRGGGIWSDGDLDITGSTITGNTAGYEGGGIVNNDYLRLSSSTVSNNNATTFGGGISNTTIDIVTIINCTISGNTAGNSGGGIFNISNWPPSQPVTVTNSTISGNTVGNAGGGIYNATTRLFVNNSTITGNAAAATRGAGIHNNTTGAAVTDVTHSIVAGQASGPDCVMGGIFSGGYNISGGLTCNFSQATDQEGVSAIDLNLGPLANNGGPTYTHLPGYGSVALDMIPVGICAVVADQRGIARPQPAGGLCDIGAVEVEPPEIDVQRPAGTSIADGGADAVGAVPVGATSLTYTIENTGQSPLVIPAGGVNASNLINVSGFTVNTALPLTIAAGTTATLQIQFNIDAVGAFSFDLDIDNNDPTENPYDIAVSGLGTGNLAAMAACNGDDLDVNITAGDNPFDITGTGPTLPQNGVGTGITTLTGPGNWTAVTVTETAGDTESTNLGDFTCPALQALAATATCNGPDLNVTITAGDPNFNISADDPAATNQTQNNVLAGTYTLTSSGGYGTWSGITVTELGGDTEVANLPNVTCNPPMPGGGGSGSGSGAAQVQAPGCNVTIDVEADREVVSWGDQVVWTVLIHNPGPDECQGVQTYGTMPGEFAIMDINTTRGSINWDGGQYYLVELGSLVAGDQVTVTLDSLLQGGAGFVLPEGAAGQSAGQQICLTGYITEPVNDTDCVTLFPDTLPSTGGEPVHEPRHWVWVVAAGMLIVGLGGYTIRRRLA